MGAGQDHLGDLVLDEQAGLVGVREVHGGLLFHTLRMKGCRPSRNDNLANVVSQPPLTIYGKPCNLLAIWMSAQTACQLASLLESEAVELPIRAVSGRCESAGIPMGVLI